MKLILSQDGWSDVPATSSAMGGAALRTCRFSTTRPKLLPLPGGEGRGEGGSKKHLAPPYRFQDVLHLAFTLIELMVVISIIAILAGLVAWGTSKAARGKVENRARTELNQLIGAVDSYHKKYGFYPPDTPTDPARPPLYYELVGSNIPPAALASLPGVQGIANTETNDQGRPFNFAPGLRPSSVSAIPPNSPPNNAAYFLVFPYQGPNGQPNTWHYRSSKPEHNTETYDLWVDVVVSGVQITIANWKD